MVLNIPLIRLNSSRIWTTACQHSNNNGVHAQLQSEMTHIILFLVFQCSSNYSTETPFNRRLPILNEQFEYLTPKSRCRVYALLNFYLELEIFTS